MFDNWQSKLRTIIDLLEASDVNEIELSFFGRKYRVSKGSSGDVTHVAMPSPQVIQSAPVLDNSPTPTEPVAAPAGVEITAPMVGTFYSASSPESPPYVEVNDHVTVGQTLCIIEAMKIMNEIESDVTGRVTKVLTENAQAVEYGQPLFVVEPD